MNPWWLLLIVPLAFSLGFAAGAALARTPRAGDESDLFRPWS